MKITFIKPNMGRMMTGSYVDEGRMEPLQLGILAGLTPDDIDIAFYDDRMEDIPYIEPTDLVMITVETFTAKRSYEIAKIYQKKGIPVVMGGMHVTLTPDEVAEYADTIVIGDAEPIWLDLIEDAKKGQLKAIYKSTFGHEPQKGFFPNREIFKGKGYLPISLMQFSRGCVNGCRFCASSVYFEKNQYCRSIESVVEEIKVQKLKLIFFVDDNIVAHREKAKELFRALIPLKIKWVSQASIDMTEDEELMKLMMRSGCLGNVIGFESIDGETLQAMNKSSNISGLGFDGYKKQLKILRKYGHQTWAAFTLGHEKDTKASILNTLAFAKKNKFAFAAYNVLMPYPNTQLYEDLAKEGRLLYNGKWWLHDDFRFNHAPYKPVGLTSEELTEVGFYCRKSFNSLGSILYRATDFKTNMRTPYKLATYLIYNPLFRKEVFKKQSMQLGEGDIIT
jgi:radical SAM superfamily enzyme YgiQ (UPF0313 family)